MEQTEFINLKKETKKQRDSRLELLRIISMLLIVFFHASRSVCVNSAVAKSYNLLIGMWGLLGVDLFVIISAYFLVEQKFKAARILDIALRTGAYIVFITLLCLGWSIYRTGNICDSLIEVIKYHALALFNPLWTNQYWFVTAYLFMVLISPLLNCLLNKLESKKILHILGFFSFVPVFANFGGGGNKVNDILNFLYIYLLVGYLKKANINLCNRNKSLIYLLVSTVALILGRFISTLTFTNKILIFIQYICSYTIGNYGRHSLFILVEALLFFNYVMNTKAFHSKLINSVSSHTFGVYLFHENPLFNIVDLVIGKGFALGLIKDGFLFIPTYTGAVLGILISGLIVDNCYSSVIHKPLMNLFRRKLGEKLDLIDQRINTEFAS